MSLTVQKYTKKPVEIEAIQFTKDNVEAVLEFLKTGYEPGKQIYGFNSGTFELQIHTLEGVMNADGGDYIIKGLKGEFYPCKPDIFEKSYFLEIPLNLNTYRIEHFEYDRDGNVLYFYKQTSIDSKLLKNNYFEVPLNHNTYSVEHFEYDINGIVLYHYRETQIDPKLLN